MVPGLHPALIPASSCLQLIRDSGASLGSHPDQGFDPVPVALGWEVRMWLTGIEFCGREGSLPPVLGVLGDLSVPQGWDQLLADPENSPMEEQGYLRLSASVCRVSYE